MARLSSARTAVSHDVATSHSRSLGGRQSSRSHSPATRRTRSTRSQSRDLGEPFTTPPTKKSARSYGNRESSVDSDASRQSASRRKRKNTHAAARTRDLSIVAEDEEEQTTSSKSISKIQEQSKWPEGSSRMSGTTTLTSHPSQTPEDLDAGMLVELLPDLWRDTTRLLNLLVFEGISVGDIESLLSDLHTVGSKGKRLRHIETGFENTKNYYGSDVFIDSSLIFRKLSIDQDLSEGAPRPDVVLQGANVATMVKSLLVSDIHLPTTLVFLRRLDDSFPLPFLSGFGDALVKGSSALAEETFDLALELRTQTAIAILRASKEDPDFDPDILVTKLFFEIPPGQYQPSSGEVFIEGIPLRSIAGFDFGDDPEPQVITERLEAIFTCFRQESAIAHSNRVRFELLDDQFPWNAFLAKLLEWSLLRKREIEDGINAQGDVGQITRSLARTLKDVDDQIRLDLNSPPPQPVVDEVPPPPAAIIPASATGKSLLSSKTVQLLTKRRFGSTSANGPKQQGLDTTSSGISRQPQTPSSQGLKVREAATAPAEISNEQGLNDHLPNFEDDFGEEVSRPTAQLLDILLEREQVEAKESHAPRQRPTMYDRQKGAHRVAFDSQDEGEDVGAFKQLQRPPKRPANAISQDEEHIVENPTQQQSSSRRGADSILGDEDAEISEDEGFQEASDIVNPARRAQAPVINARAPIPVTHSPQPPPKRARVSYTQEQKISQQQASRADSRGVQDHDFGNAPRCTPQEACEEAKLITARRSKTKVQSRTPWSIEDTEHLVGLIGTYGSNWAGISTIGGFEREVDQVGLRDKARNIKVDYLKSGAFLPRNFDSVALGAKEKAKVRAVGMNPYRLEGEEPGAETHDMDGMLL